LSRVGAARDHARAGSTDRRPPDDDEGYERVRELHVVALSSDGRHLVVTPTKGSLKGAYLLPVNARLRKALNGELNPKPKPAPEPAPAPPKPAPAESRLSPREIQARLRAGHTPERVARAAGVPVDRVTRFSGPVLSERALVVDAAREATLTRARLGASAAPLGPSVAANLAAKKAPAPNADDWTAYRKPDGSWVVALTVAGRGKPRRAEWTWQPGTRTLTANDAYAAALGHVDRPIRPRPRGKR
jgi:hypothetical protein